MENREAIEWLKGCVVSYEVDNKGRPNGNITCDLTQEVLDLAISALKKQEQDRWIPVTERLPEEYGEYRITWETSSDPGKRFIGDAEYEPGYEWDNDHDRFKGEWLLEDYIKIYPNVEVIAWKPIGEPYTEEENDQP